MTAQRGLYWQPIIPDWRARLSAIKRSPNSDWKSLVELANARLDFIATNALDEVLRKSFTLAPPNLDTLPVKIAILGSSTMTHLQAAIRVGALRRGIHTSIYECGYGQFMQELHDNCSGLHQFKPSYILFALDAQHLSGGVNAAANTAEADDYYSAVCQQIQSVWDFTRQTFKCAIIHQTALPVLPNLLGSNDHRVPGSRSALIARLNADLRRMADRAGVNLLSIDAQAARDGIDLWHDQTMWYRAKQEVSPAAAPVYGDLVGRLLAAAQGRSAKCLVLDLDNTLWGGIVGDDGLEGLVLGQGSAQGEAFHAVQVHALELSRRGIILAVCSKNDESRAIEPFESHPEMVLKRSDISSFHANWGDKATNLRAIAQELKIGLDAIVFLDDNPFERNLVRQELPMVAVPEVPEDPALVPQCLADAGYFEGLGLTQEDRERVRQYQGNREREALQTSATDMPTYLRSLEMRLLWKPFDSIGLSRIAQLINKTNQFNLRTQRYTEDEVSAAMSDSQSFGLQFRLIDRFGDNGIIGVTIAQTNCAVSAPKDLAAGDCFIDTWLMSCRVLGRQVEDAVLQVLIKEARRRGAERLVGEYRPTGKNGMVKSHYERLAFTRQHTDVSEATRWFLNLAGAICPKTFIDITAEI